MRCRYLTLIICNLVPGIKPLFHFLWYSIYLFWVLTGRVQKEKKKRGRQKNSLQCKCTRTEESYLLCACLHDNLSRTKYQGKRTSQGPGMKWAPRLDKGRKGTCLRSIYVQICRKGSSARVSTVPVVGFRGESSLSHQSDNHNSPSCSTVCRSHPLLLHHSHQ